MESIDHVILLTPENRSFHYVLGFLEDHSSHYNIDTTGNRIPCGPVDPMTGGDSIIHDIAATSFAIRGIEGVPMTGFVAANQLGIYNREAVECTCYRADPAQIMGYVKEGGFPILHSLAKNFRVCNRWFSSVPTETFPNRSYMIAATSKGRDNNVPRKIWETIYDTPTIFDRLEEKKLSWKIYYPNYLDLITNIDVDTGKGFAPLEKLLSDIKGSKLPTFSYVELDTNDDSISNLVPYRNWVEGYIGRVYTTLRNSKYWKNCLLIIAFDEHGGFYDPLPPPPATSPDGEIIRVNDQGTFKFDRYGVRVPAILISPWVDPGFDETVYDHTSVLAFLEHRFNLPPLTDRDRNATPVGRFRTRPREDKVKVPVISVTPETTSVTLPNRIMGFIGEIIKNICK